MSKQGETAKISQKFIASCQQTFRENRQSCLAQNAVTHVDLHKVAMSRRAFYKIEHTFSHQVKDEGKVTNQKSTGRCWLFAALNVLRLPLMKKYKLTSFEFSQAYLFFWDKLEKANYFLESIITTRNEDLHSRLVMWILTNPLEDGGQWHMFVNLVKKYGLVPQSAMPETHHSSHSLRMNALLHAKLREFACDLRLLHEEGASLQKLRQKKNKQLEEIYRILSIFLGTPPQTFDWHFRDKKKKYSSFTKLTPKNFFRHHVPCNLDKLVCLIHAPTKDKPMHKVYTIEYLGNVVGGDIIRYLNIPIKDLKAYTCAALKSKQAVWFGCDVGKLFDRDLGVMDLDLYDYELVFNTKLHQNKADRLNYRQSCMTHAMVFTGVDIKKGKSTKWRVENSWGDKYGDKGYYLMTDKWFDNYLYEVVIDERFLPAKVRSLAKQKPFVLPPWDPMGSLAC